MEEDINTFDLKSRFLHRNSIQRQLELLKDVAEEAADRRKEEDAHNPEILFALDIVERFLRKRKRVCYGGTAINALLPPSLKFYEPHMELPDYDFFTPNAAADIKELVHDLKAAGFQEVVERIGMHEGTHKILVNFVAIADITEMHPDIYKVLLKDSYVRDGIHFAGPDFLRMMMYLELSRPRGDVKRWEKVFERLLLLNVSFPIKSCHTSIDETVGKIYIPFTIRKEILDFIISEKRVLVGADVVALYDWYITKRKKQRPSMQWFLRRHGAIVFLSPDPHEDAAKLKLFLRNDDIHMKTLPPKAEMVPERIVLSYKDAPFIMIVQEIACHSYSALMMKSGRQLLIGSLETMLTLYYSLYFFTKDDTILQFSMLCLCQKLVEMSQALHRLGQAGPFPSFSIECSGYQKGYTTLLKEKFARIKKAKEESKAKNKSIKRNKSGGKRRAKTRKYRS